MEITCPNCQSRFRVADEKVPPGRKVSMPCPKCQGKIEIHLRPEKGASAESGSLEKVVGEVYSGDYDASEKPFDYIRAGKKAALLCEHDVNLGQKIRLVLDRMHYHVVEAESARLALKYMRYHVYDLIVLNEVFEAASAESNYVLQYLCQLPMDIRRDTFVILIGSGLKTMDNMMAFNRSVNLVMNVQDVGDLENILTGALVEHQEFYQVFTEVLKKIK